MNPTQMNTEDDDLGTAIPSTPDQRKTPSHEEDTEEYTPRPPAANFSGPIDIEEEEKNEADAGNQSQQVVPHIPNEDSQIQLQAHSQVPGAQGQGQGQAPVEPATIVDQVLQNYYQSLLDSKLKTYQAIPQEAVRGIDRKTLRVRKLNRELETVEDFQELWKLMEGLKTHERYVNLVGPILRFVDRFPEIAETFEVEVTRSKCKDLVAWREYLKAQNAASFHLMDVLNSDFNRIPDDELKLFNSFRIATVKFELLKCLVATLELWTIRHQVDGGFQYTYPQEGLLQGSQPSKRQIHHDSYVAEKIDPLTKVDITKKGTEQFHECFTGSLALDINGATSKLLGVMQERVPSNLLLPNIKPTDRFLIVPLLRSMCETYAGEAAPVLQGIITANGCRMLRRSFHSHTDETMIQPKTEFLSSFTSLKANADSKIKGSVFTNILTKFEYEQWCDDEGGAGGGAAGNPQMPKTPIKHDLLYHLIDRKSQFVRCLVSEGPTQINRKSGRLSKSKKENQTVTHELKIGFEVKQKYDSANRWISDFFQNDCYLTVDPELMLYNITPQDRFQCHMKVDWLEGEKRILAAYLLVSSLHYCCEANLADERHILHSNVTNHGCEQSFYVLTPYLTPDEFEVLNKIMEEHRNARADV